jgi:hypothetical protein
VFGPIIHRICLELKPCALGRPFVVSLLKLVGDRRCSAGLPVELAGSLPVLEGGERGV